MKLLGNSKTIIENVDTKGYSDKDLRNVTEINITFDLGIFTRRTRFKGYLRFENNNTSLRQDFNGKSIDDVYLQIFNFCNSL